MPRGGIFDVSFLILSSLAVVFAIVAYLKDPGLPLPRRPQRPRCSSGSSCPRLIPALILAGMLQVLIPQETVARYFGRAVAASRAICIARVAGVLTPGGPMVSVPLLVVLANSGMALGPLVAYMTVVVALRHAADHRVGGAADGLALRGGARPPRASPSRSLAGWLVKLYYHE